MDILIATKNYEQWLSSQIQLVLADLRHKHSAMATDPFSFLRATYYRWAQQFLEMKTPISQAPNVLAVGDLHLENFGTWRDGLGRLAWGINDFDDAFPLPYTNDLVRLATSTLLSINLNHLRLEGEGCLSCYRRGLSCRH